MKKLLFGVFVAASMAAPCFAADSPWNGTWKVNEAKSKFTGNTFTISEKSGMMHYANGGPVEWDFACDGKDYPTLPDRSFACTKTGKMTFATVTKVKGQEVARGQREISKDGKTMTISTSGKQADGSAFTDHIAFTRVSGTQGMVGKWKSTKDTYSGTEIAKITLAGNVLHMEYPSMKESVDAKLDGTPAAMTGPQVPPGMIMEAKAEGPLSVHYTIKLNGKATGEGTEVVSADGKTLTDTFWTPGKMTEKQIAVYERQ